MPLPSALRSRRHAPAIALAVVLLLSGSAAAWLALAPHAHDAADEGAPGHAAHAASPLKRGGGHAAHGAAAGEDHAHGTPAVACPRDARVPDPLDLSLLTLGTVHVRGDSGFTPEAGVRGGNGTPHDPFVIRGIRARALVLSDTSAFFVLAGSDVGTLALDWNGAGGLVCRNHIGDLRVNRNVDRYGAPTAGVLEENRIDRVGQIRHFDGVFRRNEVGTPTSTGVVLNIDGMNGADFVGNAIRGGVDMKLHGHHHGEPGKSHMHVAAANPSDAAAYEDVDHSVRHILFQFRENSVTDPSGFGLRYNDRNHAGDDRTAASETTPELEKPHVHVTTIRIEENTVVHAPLRVEIVNAPDERHLPGQGAEVLVRKNVVRDAVLGSGILVSAVEDAHVRIEENRVERAALLGVPLNLGTHAGIDLAHAKSSAFVVSGNTITGFPIGIRARTFDEATSWVVMRNTIDASRYDVYWDGSVANPPARP